ncbi:MAG: PQQ-binding-like beta-propeller repeat protein [Chloroflexi bacterium]|nr:PQQ-binding-like beta-propeller repeat protein [Chloroflexota bacterium]
MSATAEALLGHYQLLDRLGSTGLATVYRARDVRSGSVVAVKVLRPYFAQEAGRSQRFLQEMERVQKLRHPSIVPLYAVQQAQGQLFIATGYVSWPSLSSAERGSFPPAQLPVLLRQVAAALDYAHGQGVVHRDLRPSNVFFHRESGQAVVSDFGMATLAEEAHPLIRSTVNTPLPGFPSPQHLLGQPPAPSDDIYGLGALVYVLATGEVPFGAISSATTLSRQLAGQPIPPSQRNPSLPPRLDAAVLKALARHPQQRYATASELAEAVARALEEPVSPHQPLPSPALLAQAARAPLPAPAPPADARVLCPSCGMGNPASAARCSTCWGSLAAQPVVTREEERRRVGAYLAALRGKKRLRVALLIGTATLLLGYWAYRAFDLRPALPAPATTIASTSAPAQWSMLHRDPQRTGFMPEADFAPKGTTRWQFPSDDPLLASPAVAGGRVFLATSDRRVVALDQRTGELLWTHPVNGPVNSSPAVAGDRVFLGLRDGSVLALRAATGELDWRFDAGSGVISSPVVVDGALYVGSGDHNVYALDAATGERRWSIGTEGWVVSSPAISQGVLVAASQTGVVYLINPSKGAVRFRSGAGTGVSAGAAIAGDRAFVVTTTGNVLALRLDKREVPLEKAFWTGWFNLYVWGSAPPPPNPPGLVWLRHLRELVTADMALADGRLFVATREGTLHALDIATGRQLWKSPGLAPLHAAPIVAGGTVIQAAFDGTVYGFDASTGLRLWAISVGKETVASPVLADGVLYVPSGNGTLYAVE